MLQKFWVSTHGNVWNRFECSRQCCGPLEERANVFEVSGVLLLPLPLIYFWAVFTAVYTLMTLFLYMNTVNTVARNKVCNCTNSTRNRENSACFCDRHGQSMKRSMASAMPPSSLLATT